MYNGQASPEADTPADIADDTPNDASAAQSGLAEDAGFDDGSYKLEGQLVASIVSGEASGAATIISLVATATASDGDASGVGDSSSAEADGGMTMGEFRFGLVLAKLIFS